MKLKLEQAGRELIRNTHRELLLGIIIGGRIVRLAVADPIVRPGHVDWIRRESIRNATAGFSMFVENGLVSWLVPRSQLNPPDGALDREIVDKLVRLLQKSDGFVVARD